MRPVQLIRWQWDGYFRYHAARTNLIIHIFAVPLFLVGNLTLVMALLRASALWSAIGLACMVLAMGLQGRGHKVEKIPPEPFSGMGNAAARIFIEQWVTFPRFVLSGGWMRALRAPGSETFRTTL
jgi:hypothetical protein